jgi:pimeloyl-ACP methyl ester carboxylesterase
MSHSAFVIADAVRLHYLEWNPHVQRTQSGSNLTRTTQVTQVLDSDTPCVEHNQALTPDNDAIPLVFLHSLGATAETWDLVAQHLYQHHPLVAFDLRGHGQSDHPDQSYDLATVAEDVICGMAELGLGQVVLIGHGWGARVALVLAARHPALISHLVLVDCPHVEPRHWPGMTRERFLRESEKSSQNLFPSLTSYIEAMRSEMSVTWSPEIEAIVKTYVHVLPDGSVESLLRPEHQRQIRASVWEDRALLYYSKLACPVLLVPAAACPQPGEEPPERMESADEFAAAKGYMVLQVAGTIQYCSVLWMPDTVHDVQLQRPQILANNILRFVQDVTV